MKKIMITFYVIITPRIILTKKSWHIMGKNMVGHKWEFEDRVMGENWA